MTEISQEPRREAIAQVIDPVAASRAKRHLEGSELWRDAMDDWQIALGKADKILALSLDAESGK